MTADTPRVIEASPVDTAVMVKRVFKVAELLTRHTAKTDHSIAKNGCENPDSKEIEYCGTDDQQQM